MTEPLEELQREQRTFLEERDWEQFHTPKSLAMAISVEAAELIELFQWHDNLPAEAYENDETIEAAVEEELADVLIYCLSMAAEFDIDLEEAANDKIAANANRFDEETAADIRAELERWESDRESDD